jgi:hypothetical protein
MRTAPLLAAALLMILPLAPAAIGGDDHEKHEGAVHSPLLGRFKKLEGRWTGKMSFDGQEIDGAVAVYKVTSNGSTVVETLGPGTPHEMVTVIHPDRDSLVLTHYCAIGNQPRMRAKGKPTGSKITFEFADVTNADPAKDTFMHDATFEFLSDDEFKADWTNYSKGKPSGKATFHLRREKAETKGK